MSLITVIGDGLTVAYNNKDIPPSVSGWLSIANLKLRDVR